MKYGFIFIFCVYNVYGSDDFDMNQFLNDVRHGYTGNPCGFGDSELGGDKGMRHLCGWLGRHLCI